MKDSSDYYSNVTDISEYRDSMENGQDYTTEIVELTCSANIPEDERRKILSLILCLSANGKFFTKDVYEHFKASIEESESRSA